MEMKKIRNFCIIAHIDHGKSTLADRLLELTQTVDKRNMENQVLDAMSLEREKGITIKSHAIQMQYKGHILNLIDTPGHVDFSYEVSRSIASCEGALLVVDASQGVQAQTIANLYHAIEHNLEIIPIINKIDMDAAQPDVVADEIIDLIGCKSSDIFRISARTGEGVPSLLDAIIERIPAPSGDPSAPLQALIFDSVFNTFRGVVAYFKVKNGSIKRGQQVRFMATGEDYEVDELGVLKIKLMPTEEIGCGSVGYAICNIKSAKEVKVGDTITSTENPAAEAIAGFEEVKPMVFAGMYPVQADKFEELRTVLEKFQLNDASFVYEPESSLALGSGFRCGFLGLLHLEIVQERLFREFDMDVITTVPNVSYKVYTTHNEVIDVHNPSGLPPQTMIDHIEEPYIRAQIISKAEFFDR